MFFGFWHVLKIRKGYEGTMKKVMLTLAVVSAMALPLMAEEACTNKVEKTQAAVKCTDAAKAAPAEAAKPAEAAPAKAE